MNKKIGTTKKLNVQISQPQIHSRECTDQEDVHRGLNGRIKEGETGIEGGTEIRKVE